MAGPVKVRRGGITGNFVSKMVEQVSYSIKLQNTRNEIRILYEKFPNQALRF
jgi:hypothetical protein